MSMKTNMSVERLATAPTRPAAVESVELMDWSSAFLLYLKKSQFSFRELDFLLVTSESELYKGNTK